MLSQWTLATYSSKFGMWSIMSVWTSSLDHCSAEAICTGSFRSTWFCKKLGLLLFLAACGFPARTRASEDCKRIVNKCRRSNVYCWDTPRSNLSLWYSSQLFTPARSKACVILLDLISVLYRLINWFSLSTPPMPWMLDFDKGTFLLIPSFNFILFSHSEKVGSHAHCMLIKPTG